MSKTSTLASTSKTSTAATAAATLRLLPLILRPACNCITLKNCTDIVYCATLRCHTCCVTVAAAAAGHALLILKNLSHDCTITVTAYCCHCCNHSCITVYAPL
jgi:hypothetical protein